MKYITAAVSLSITLGASVVQAQITPDNTLGADRSNVNNNLIQGGAQRGTNLFHSFTDFSIGDGQRVNFVNPIGVNNIITRVTDTPSNINGTLGVLGNANLFFLNPNGIFFGQNSRLDMAGTFVGSTANGLKFADGNVYSTVNPQAPLLTMTTPVGLQFGGRTGDITFTGATNLLANYDGNSILFAGGNITLTGSKLILPNGKVELAAVSESGSIAIDSSKLNDPKAQSLTVPNGLERSDITIQNSSLLNTSGTNSGNVDLQGRNITISGTSDEKKPIINTQSTGTDVDIKGGNVSINATGDVIISGKYSGISTSTLGATMGGDITISARNLQILDGAYLEASAYNVGDGGQISIAVSDTVKLASTTGDESAIENGLYATGLGGDIYIQTNKLINRDGSQIWTTWDDLLNNLPTGGKQGDINIIARESVEVSGVSTGVVLSGFPKPTAITSFSAGKSDSGNINIQTPKFTAKDGASISAGTDGSGRGGLISITGLNGGNAEFVELFGNSNLSQFLGTENNPAFAGVGNGSRIRSITSNTGNAGVVKINADRVTLQGGTRIDVSTTRGSGQGGSIDINAKTVELIDGGQLISTTRGSGQAGKINVQADKIINLNGIDSTFEAKRTFLSLILVVTNQPATRKALNNYLQNPNSTSQQSVIANWQQENNNPIDREILQQYFAFLKDNPMARSSLQSFLAKTDGQTSLSDYNILFNVGNNSGIVSRSQPDSTGNGGNITISTPNLNIQKSAVVTVNSNGNGRGGNINVTADNINLDRGAITAKTVSNNGGDIDLNVNKLLILRNQSEISASAAANGNGGNINIFAPNGLILAVPIENSDITASAAGGQGGRIQIRADNVLGFSTQRLDSSSNIAATSTFGAQGIVTVTTLGNDPNKGLQPDPIAPNPPTLSQTCARNSDKQASTFIDSGKGGITPSASEPLRSGNLWVDSRVPNSPVSSLPMPPSIESAQGWKMGSNRTVILTSQPTNNLESMVKDTTPNCVGVR